MVRIAVIGDTETIKGFASVGFDIYPCDDAQGAPELLRRLAGGEYGVIYITEELAGAVEREMKRYEEQLTPAVIPIPGVKGNTGLGMRRLSESVEKAVGSDILFG